MNPVIHNRTSYVRDALQHQRRMILPWVAMIMCLVPADVNAIQAKQEGVVPASFARSSGKTHALHNVAIIIDTTASMNVVDKDLPSQCKGSRLDCMLAGIRILLSELSPCKASKSICGTATNGNVANAVDTVSLFAFPNVTVGMAINDYNCADNFPRTVLNSFPAAGASTYAPPNPPETTPTYEVVNYSSDYRTSAKATTLNPNSDLVKAVHGVSGCSGIKAVGGQGDYFAGAIYAAQASLVAEQAARPGSQNVMILVGEGYAKTSVIKVMAPGTTDSGMYPSWIDECGQAIMAAKAAATAGTRVYAVAYGGDSSRICPTDTSGPYQGYSSCQTMKAIASSPAYFFSTPMVFFGTQGSYPTTCDSATHPITDMNWIFAKIAKSIKAARSTQKKRRGIPG